ncbi:NaeI family type II restriction endonuclease [Nocardia sp. NPDC052001]|uniref:NaeI family type II restriction endonuclease n=1 Tax=Nocardia sp. NPDC052001 TaxID=3154853 RepID=UPI003420B341
MASLFDDVDDTDVALDQVVDEIKSLDPDGKRWAEVLRHTYDMIYNGSETGRFRWADLMKTEKTHFGTLFEINAQREFEFDGGDTTDFRIAGHQVDAKWSQRDGGWMLPPEVLNELALVATGSDVAATFSIGVVRVTPAHRREGENRDKKSSLNQAGREAVRWIWRDAPMPANILLQLPAAVVDQIFDSSSGSERVNRLFRVAEGKLVHRSVVRTVAMQLDDQKRVRNNGGARTALKSEGVIILSGYYAHIAERLGVPVPDFKHYISVRVVPGGNSDPMISGARWRRARPGEPICIAPDLPRRGIREED